MCGVVTSMVSLNSNLAEVIFTLILLYSISHQLPVTQ